MRADLSEREQLILETLPATCAYLAEVLGFTKPPTRRLIERLKAEELCYVARWDGLSPVYAIGHRPDAPRPGPRRKEVNARAYRKRKALAAGPFAQLFI